MKNSKVADLSLAQWGRKDIKLSEVEMPGLMELRKRYRSKRPFEGVKITGSLHMTVQTAVLIETLKEMGLILDGVLVIFFQHRIMRCSYCSIR